jgi:protein-disulfide isomerase
VNKLLMLAVLGLLSACQPATLTKDDDIKQLQEQVKQLKHVQALVAQKVGLGALVRPDEISIADGQRIGNEQASLVLLEFTDLHCPFCAKYHTTIWPTLKAKYVDTNKVLFVGKEFPLNSIHPKAAFAAVVLRCAAKQNSYSDAKNYLFAKGAQLKTSDIEEIIADNNLDATRLNTCLKDGKVHNTISESLLAAKKLGLTSTPTFIIGKKHGEVITDYEIVTGASSLESFTVIFDKLLQSTGKS